MVLSVQVPSFPSTPATSLTVRVLADVPAVLVRDETPLVAAVTLALMFMGGEFSLRRIGASLISLTALEG